MRLYGVLSLPARRCDARRPDRRRRPAIPGRQPPPVHPAGAQPGRRMELRPCASTTAAWATAKERCAISTVEDDLRAALDAFHGAVPGLREVVLWGLCDGASAIAMYAARDARGRPGAAQPLGAHRRTAWPARPSSIIIGPPAGTGILAPARARQVRLIALAGNRCSDWYAPPCVRARPSRQAQAHVPCRSECMRACVHSGGQVLVIVSGADLTGARILRPGRRRSTIGNACSRPLASPGTGSTRLTIPFRAVPGAIKWPPGPAPGSALGDARRLACCRTQQAAKSSKAP
jgi:hypothetical protein